MEYSLHKFHRAMLLFYPNIYRTLLLCFFSFNSTGQVYEWAKSAGGILIDISNALITDAQGNVYITGNFADTADFDPGPDTVNLTSAGVSDIFIAKYDISGNYVWAISIGGVLGDDGKSIALDDSGNLYVTGYFLDTVDFDPGIGTAELTGAGLLDIYIAKYDTSGNYQWAISMGGVLADDSRAIALDESGNIYITGYFKDIVDFDPDTGTANLLSSGEKDIFIAKYTSSGNYLWAKNMGSDTSDIGNDLFIDSQFNVYVTGTFQDTVDFDPGSDTNNLISAGGDDIFIAKYDSSGNYLWAINIGGNSDDKGNSIFLDDSDNVYVTGNFKDTADFDPDTGTAILISAGGDDILIAKYDSSGNYVWAKNMDGDDFDVGQGIFIDTLYNIYVTGYFKDTVDFDPGPDTANLISAGDADVFLARYDATGDYVWAINMGSGAPDAGRALSIDPLYNVYVTGYFANIADFDPGPDTSGLVSAGDRDLFIAKYSQCIPPVIVQIPNSTINKCEGDSVSFIVSATGGLVPLNYQWKKDGVDISGATDTIFTIPSVTADTAGIYTCVVTNVCGADTTNPITLTVPPTNYPAFNDSICEGDSFQLPGGDWVMSPGIYQDTLISIAGCDSVLTTILAVIPLPTAGITGTTALCYGDSTVLTATGGISFLWNTGDTSASVSVSTLTDTTYFVAVTNPGCDSTGYDTVLTTINQLPEIIAVAACPVPCGDTITILKGEEAALSVSGGISYNWSPADGLTNPNTSAPIATPSETTLYYVYGTDSNGCTNVDSILIIVSDDFKIEVPDIFSPNGDGYNDIFYVSGKGVKWLIFRIFDRWGEKVFETDDINTGWNGIYNDKPMNPAVFVYYLKAGFSDGNEIEKQGQIALVR